MNFFCVGVIYSGEYDVCDVTLSVYPNRASLKIYACQRWESSQRPTVEYELKALPTELRGQVGSSM
jgi:hypothetical protein